jgi:hypothetical protein
MNSVSSAVGSKVFTTSLLPSSIRLAAVKPEPVSFLKRLSASATAPGSAESNWCLVSPVWSITICVAIVASRLLKGFRTGDAKTGTSLGEAWTNANCPPSFHLPVCGPSQDWIKVKNPDSPAMVRFREGRW